LDDFKKAVDKRNDLAKVDEETRQIQRVAFYSFLVNIGLAGIKGALAFFSGSLAVAAGAVDSATDSMASLAAYGGLKLSSRKSRRFPYGLYKIENIISVVIAFFIFFAGYEIARRILTTAEAPPDISPAIIIWFLVSVVITAFFGQYAIIIGRRTESPTLIAEGRHRQADVFSSIVILISVFVNYLDIQITLLGISIDQMTAGLVLIFIGYAGWGLLSDGMRVLLDASIDTETLNKVRKIIEDEPTVTEIRWLEGRNAGRFRFIETDIALRIADLEKAHQISRKIELSIREKVPNIERILIHYEPKPPAHLRVAVPLADSNGNISSHFGDAPYFGLILFHLQDKKIEKQEVIANPHTKIPTGKGIRVAEWLVAHRIDEVVVKEEIKHKGPGYVFSNAGVKHHVTSAGKLSEVVDHILKKN